MTDMMTFPETREEFEKSYGFVDGEKIYTNGSRLIPSFRVKQWLDHIAHRENERQATVSSDCVSRQDAIEAVCTEIMSITDYPLTMAYEIAEKAIECLPSAQPEIIRCKDCKYWRQQTNYAGAPLSFGFCESDEMWQSLYGETYEVSHIDTDDDFYCGYAERRTDEE